MKATLFVILLTISVLLLGFTYHFVHAQEMNQTEYCHDHYGNATVVCHKMPMNMTLQVSDKMPMNMTMPVSEEK